MVKWYNYELVINYFQILFKKIARIRIRIEILGWIRIQFNPDPKHCVKHWPVGVDLLGSYLLVDRIHLEGETRVEETEPHIIHL